LRITLLCTGSQAEYYARTNLIAKNLYEPKFEVLKNDLRTSLYRAKSRNAVEYTLLNNGLICTSIDLKMIKKIKCFHKVA